MKSLFLTSISCFYNEQKLPDVLMPKFCCSPRDTNCQSTSSSMPFISSLLRRATSGFMDAAFITGPITNGRYCSNCFPVNYKQWPLTQWILMDKNILHSKVTNSKVFALKKAMNYVLLYFITYVSERDK